MKIRYIFFAGACLLASLIGNTSLLYGMDNPKREFRGAWLHVIGQTQWMNKNTEQQKSYIREQFAKLHDAGCNAVIFQVRPTADALYKSDLETWSSWLTGKRGKAPNPMWDPMEYAITEAHKLGMEFHAWLNPYRVTSNPKEVLPEDHISKKYPERFVKFNGQTFFDPAYQENRDFICDVVADIVDRYDVDAVHIDDYFYPYPAGEKKFNNDDASYARFGVGKNRGDWRRHNVDLLIEQMHKTIKDHKSWVRFGVSPFGIWRNRSSDPRGSESAGLQNYDDLYADVLLWARKGWIDYMAPQLYWTLDLKVAPSRSLAKWWNDNANGVDIYIGQDTKRTMDNPDPGNNDRNELDTKVKLSRKLPNVQGNIWWHGYWVTGNYKGVADSLALKYQSTVAIPPVYGDKTGYPASPVDLKIVKKNGKCFLKWSQPEKAGGVMKEDDVVKYVVYEFFKGERLDYEDSQAIVAMTPDTEFQICDAEDEKDFTGTTFAVTSLDRMNRESRPAVLKGK